MYTARMTPAEIDRETHEDITNVQSKLKYTQEDFRRMVLKATRFPVVMRYEQNTKRKNRWKVMLLAYSRQNTRGRTAVVFYSICESELGKFVYLPVPYLQRGLGKFRTLVFKPHYMSRYRERMGRQESGEALIDHLMTTTTTLELLFFPHADGRVTVIGTMDEGFCFGESYDHDNVVLIRTFVPRKMMFSDQREVFDLTHADREQEMQAHLERLKTMSARQLLDHARQQTPEARKLSAVPKDAKEFKRWMEKAREIAPEIEMPDEE